MPRFRFPWWLTAGGRTAMIKQVFSDGMIAGRTKVSLVVLRDGEPLVKEHVLSTETPMLIHLKDKTGTLRHKYDIQVQEKIGA